MDAEAGSEAGTQQQQQQAAAVASTSSGATVPFDRSSSRLGAPGAESFDGASEYVALTRLVDFAQPWRELKDLRSQLNEAANCCEKAFLNTEKKKLILESTKSYICDAVVAVIDHLGTVSSKLEHKIEEKTDTTQMEQKLNFMKQIVMSNIKQFYDRKVDIKRSETHAFGIFTVSKSADMHVFRAAGAFAGNAPASPEGEEVEEGDEGGGGIRGGLRFGDAAEISSENTGPAASQSGGGSGDEGGHGDGGDRKRRKSYHRHTTEQIRVMEAMFKESPHPDEKQRQQLSKELGLSARQVKFWFQNRRTQIKERQENSLLRSEMDKLQEENRAMRELIKKPSPCPSCGVASGNEEHLLRLENAKLKAEIESLRGTLASPAADAVASPTSPCAIQTNKASSLDDYVAGGLLGLDKARILELAVRAMDELTAMCSAGEPLWVRSVETGRDVLNYDEYVRLFPHDDDDPETGGPGGRLRRQGRPGLCTSRRRSLCVPSWMWYVYRRFSDSLTRSNQWKELFPSMVSNASTLSVIRAGEDGGQDGVVQLMFAELQMLTPLVPTREFCFLRYCKKLGAEKWATVDVSFDKAEPGAQKSSTVCECLKKPSGCIIEEQTNGHCKVTWVEHTKCRSATVPSLYRAATASGLAFGARRWLAALQLQCERMVFSVATNIPTRDSNGVATMAGRRSVLKLAQRMTSSLCRGIGASRGTTWSKAPNGGGDVRVMSRTNTGDPGEPQGLIACAVLSTWLPVSPTVLLDLLRDETRRHEWDVMLTGRAVQSCVSVTKGKDRGNSVTIYASFSSLSLAAKSSAEEQDGKWIIQDSCVGPCESIVAYAPVDAATLRPVVDGHDSSGVAVLPCGFAVTPDGLDSKPAVITSSKDDDGRAAGSLVTVAFQALAGAPPTDDALPADSVAKVTGLVACVLGNIKKALGCEDS
ncbi:hypothetical protein EJB05_16898, partial [Eragrostis curvula]